MSQPTIKYYGKQDLDSIPQLQKFSREERFGMSVVASVLPFRTNNYVIENLIDWEKAPDDPIFQLTFLHQTLLDPHAFNRLSAAMLRSADKAEIAKIVSNIRLQMNPHPAGQLTHNVPSLNGKPVKGVQHKYRETALIFPAAGQTCFTFCSFCFRWPQFINHQDYKFTTETSTDYLTYIQQAKSLTDVLITGGDPLIMKTNALERLLTPFLGPEFDHIQNIRIGTKVLSYWPYRLTSDPDAEDLLRLFERLKKAGKQVALMAHINHPREMRTSAFEAAVARLINAGVTVRTQSPILRHINDRPEVWVEMWNRQVKLGCIPYYMFVERDTGPKQYFEIPLVEAYDIFSTAYRRVSGLARTVRGPSMSAHHGKVAISGIIETNETKQMVLTFLQSRNPEDCNRPFLAEYDEKATWLNQLKPAFGQEKFFFERESPKIPKLDVLTRTHLAKREDYDLQTV